MRILRVCVVLFTTWVALSATSRAADAAPTVFELRTYTAAPGKLPTLMARFREHTTRIFAKHGMVNVGYWTPMEAADGAGEKIVYLLGYPDRQAATAAWKSFGADPEWQDVRKASEANGKIVVKVESVFLAPTDFSPPIAKAKAAAAPRVFELRTYTAADGKLADLDARFRNHTLALFAKHGMTNLGYFHPVDADKGAGVKLVYLLAHANREAATASWKAFRDDADWVKARKESEKDGKLTTKVESVFLTPTDFSPLK